MDCKDNSTEKFEAVTRDEGVTPKRRPVPPPRTVFLKPPPPPTRCSSPIPPAADQKYPCLLSPFLKDNRTGAEVVSDLDDKTMDCDDQSVEKMGSVIRDKDVQPKRPVPPPRTVFLPPAPSPSPSTGDPCLNSRFYHNENNRDIAEVVGNLDEMSFGEKKCAKCKDVIDGENDGIKCSRNPTEEVDDRLETLTLNAEVHRLCAECVADAAEYVCEHSDCVAGNGIGIDCVSPLCNRILLFSEMHPFVPAEMEEKLQDVMVQKSMEAFCRDHPDFHFFDCVKCSQREIVNESSRFHECSKCHAYQCWFCGRLATEAHKIRSCEEMDRAERYPSPGFLHFNSILLKPQFV